MDDLRTLVRDQMSRAGMPAYSLHDLDRRHHRKRRNQRVVAGVIGVAVFVVFASAVVAAIRGDLGSQPGRHPSPSPTGFTGGIIGDPAPAGEELPSGLAQPLEPGQHWVASGGWRVSFDVPRGWMGWEIGIVDPADGGESPSGTGIGFWSVRYIWDHPCSHGDIVPTGHTVDGLVDALAGQPLRSATTPTDVEVDGFDGKVMRIYVPEDVNFADCYRRQFESWPGRYHQGPGQIDQIWVLDVDGARLVIDAWWFPKTTAAARAELFEIVESIQIRPTAGP
jgi:hypothetical protein